MKLYNKSIMRQNVIISCAYTWIDDKSFNCRMMITIYIYKTPYSNNLIWNKRKIQVLKESKEKKSRKLGHDNGRNTKPNSGDTAVGIKKRTRLELENIQTR